MSGYFWTERKNEFLEGSISLSDGPDGLLGCVEYLKGEWVFSIWNDSTLRVGGFSDSREGARRSVEKCFKYISRLPSKMITERSKVGS